MPILQHVFIRCLWMVFLYQMSVDKNKEKDIWQFGDPSTYINQMSMDDVLILDSSNKNKDKDS